MSSLYFPSSKKHKVFVKFVEKGFSFPAKEALLCEYRTTHTAQIFPSAFPSSRPVSQHDFEGGEGTRGTCQPGASKAVPTVGKPWHVVGTGRRRACQTYIALVEQKDRRTNWPRNVDSMDNFDGKSMARSIIVKKKCQKSP